jgi:uncharacterized radical SAM superfamily Fe-S cluster-containing enzyme
MASSELSLGRRVERLATRAANAVWPLLRRYQERFSGPDVTPSWAPGRLVRKSERSFPTLGFPRHTDSLCPKCVKEVRNEVLAGKRNLDDFIKNHPGEIPALIEERDGGVFMEKTCPKHGRFEEVLAIDSAFLRRVESLFPGRDYLSPKTSLREHGSSSIKYGRGAVLTVDLTNRCNMMCEPCFMDANQVGYVHELSFDDVKRILDDALAVKPRRQMSVQFSGGEPTLHDAFLESVRYARDVGYFCVQCATNGIRFAQDPELCRQAKEAGLRLVYLQFDGIGNEANSHRKIGNLFDVKLKAIENLAAAGIDVVLVVTVVRGVNDSEVGRIVQFAIENADKITVVSFQPVSFTGRDEDVDDETRKAQRYTLSHLAHDLSLQLGATRPEKDWYPLSAMNPFSDVVDLTLGASAEFGALKCGCHPNCGVGTILLVNKRTRQMVPVSEVLDVDQLLRDLTDIADAGHGKKRTLAAMALALLRNFRPENAPPGFDLSVLVRQVLSQMGAKGDAIGASEGDAADFEWRFLFVAGMHFQDLFNYDFRRTEMCIIPYGTQLGEISFCAYNTGVGWRQIVEKMYRTASVAEWFREHGKHPVYAKHQRLPLPGDAHDSSDGKVRLRLVDQSSPVG